MPETTISSVHNTNWLEKRPVLFEIVFPALVVVLGVQVIRILIAGLTWTIGDRLALSAPLLGLIALFIFGSTVFSRSLCTLLGRTRCMVFLVLLLCLCRALLQVWWGEPIFNTLLAGAGTMGFLLFLPAYIDRSRLSGTRSAGFLLLGILLGLAMDTAIYGVYGTYDLAWQTDIWSMVLILLLIGAITWFLQKGRRLVNPTVQTNTIVLPAVWPLLALGPFLFLQLQVFQNIARLSVFSGWQMPVAFAWVMMAHLVAIVLVTRVLYSRPVYIKAIIILACVMLLVTSLLPDSPGLLAGIYLLFGQAASSLILLSLLVSTSAPLKHHKPSTNASSSVPVGAGMIVLVVLILSYYAAYQIDLPFNNGILEPMAAFILVSCALVSLPRGQLASIFSQRIWLVPAACVLLLTLSFGSMITWQKPDASTFQGEEIAVMSYNLHNGFDTRGFLGLQELANNIEQLDPDIVALQEISRGWLVSGRTDMLDWLSFRLGMPYTWGETAGPLWGNAILSRFPISIADNYPLPSEGLPIERGFIDASIEILPGHQLRVIATHFHHLEEDSSVRIKQTETLLEHWNGTSDTLIMGDLNAEPDSPEMQLFYQSGLIDVISSIEPPTACTFHADDPYQRIDYIWASEDIEYRGITVLSSTASDHLAIFAMVKPSFTAQ